MSTRFSAPCRPWARRCCGRAGQAYLDPNREPFELDQGMFEDALPDFVNAHSPRVRVGLGTVARVVASGEEIYARKLRFAEAVQRVERLYRPYHRALNQLLEATRARFGFYTLLDCHSMRRPPCRRIAASAAASISCWATATTSCDLDHRRHRAALVDREGLCGRAQFALCGRIYHHFITASPTKAGIACRSNWATCPMNEATYERKPFFAQLATDMKDLALALAAIEPTLLRVA